MSDADAGGARTRVQGTQVPSPNAWLQNDRAGSPRRRRRPNQFACLCRPRRDQRGKPTARSPVPRQDKLRGKIAERRPRNNRVKRTRTRRPPDRFPARCLRAAASVECARKTTCARKSTGRRAHRHGRKMTEQEARGQTVANRRASWAQAGGKRNGAQMPKFTPGAGPECMVSK